MKNDAKISNPFAEMEDDLRTAVEVLKKGGVILYPTDTIWGIGCDATNEDAVKKVYEIKQRDDSKALITLTDSAAAIERIADMPAVAYDVIEACAEDQPMTIIYDGGKNVASNLLAEDGSIGIRVTFEKFSAELCHRLRRPLVSTSANISGQPSPASFSDISDEIKTKVDYVVKYRQNDNAPHKPSKIIRLKPNGAITIIRK